MKICIFSDVHGNFLALQQMIHKEESNVDYFIFVGDIFGYFYEQKEVINQLTKMERLYAVRGNHDQNYLLSRNNELYRHQLVEKYGCSYNLLLSEVEMEYIQKLPECMEIQLEDKSIGIFHGGLTDHMTQRIYPDTELDEEIYGQKYDYLFLGHTHYQILKKTGKTFILNPGSIGQPRDGKGFSYCILNTVENQVLFKSVNLDIKKLLKDVKERDFGTKNCEYLLKKYGGLHL